ncbi:hypothetical protein AMELA_G00004530 [Ameiurus melas]|uniref:Uncharacterized protein n=1 Tax=Ameiurus melas TaxID=219545 RepID=A0A7J6BEV5_AMEME|nr:hypothetical protein AMELA_G00004530 [Ameiurus melas]
MDIGAIHFLYRLSYRVVGNLEPNPGGMGDRAGYTLDRVPIHRRAHSHTHSHTTDTLDMPISLPCMSFDWGTQPEYPEETPTARGEHANSIHTGQRQKLNPQPWTCNDKARMSYKAEKLSWIILQYVTDNPRTLRHVESCGPGIEPSTLRLLDIPFYHLIHSRPVICTFHIRRWR